MEISIIVAIAQNNAIGKNNDLLWHLPHDMKYFKQKTEGHCIITGRKNYFSIPEKFRPLANRTNIVVTREKNLELEGAVVVNSIDEALNFAIEKGEKEVFIIGGGEIYKQTLALATVLYITEVDAIFDDADTYFPEINLKNWKEITRENHSADDKNLYNYSFVIYKKIKK